MIVLFNAQHVIDLLSLSVPGLLAFHDSRNVAKLIIVRSQYCSFLVQQFALKTGRKFINNLHPNCSTHA